MVMSYDKDKRLHDTIGFIGLRAQATVVGLIQLCRELRRAGVLEEAALDRIKQAITRELALSRPRSASREEYEANLACRLDRLFDGEEDIGGATPSMAAKRDCEGAAPGQES